MHSSKRKLNRFEKIQNHGLGGGKKHSLKALRAKTGPLISEFLTKKRPATSIAGRQLTKVVLASPREPVIDVLYRVFRKQIVRKARGAREVKSIDTVVVIDNRHFHVGDLTVAELTDAMRVKLTSPGFDTDAFKSALGGGTRHVYDVLTRKHEYRCSLNGETIYQSRCPEHNCPAILISD